MNNGFDNDKYLREQTAAILKRMERLGNRLYLEFGGKLIYDYHAARVLPGFHPNGKMRLLQELRDRADILLCIYAGDIERRKIRADFGITYDVDAMKLIDDLKSWELEVRAVIITRYEGQPAAAIFKNKLERRGVTVYTHRFTKGYPTDVDTVVSDQGYGANPYVETIKPLVVVTGPGPCSGKLATCLSQMYHDHRRGLKSGYAKFETFPIWDLPLKHPVNAAYEAATADIRDFNMIDPYHLEAYGKSAVNYNRDVEVFPVLKRILVRITDDPAYRSPTDMGVNCAGAGIVDDGAVREAAGQEVIRRYFRYRCEHVMGFVDQETVQRVELILDELGLKPEDRPVVGPARKAAAEGQEKGKGHEGIHCGTAIKLHDGTVLTGKNSVQMHAASSLVLNAVKHLAGIPDRIHLLSPAVIGSIADLDRQVLNKSKASLDLGETLIALSVSAMTNPTAQEALGRLKELQGCEVHSTHIPTPGDEEGLRKLGVNLTSDPNFSSHSLFAG